MPIDPNGETSDVGMMYRQYLQSKGMPLTQGNLQSVIAQSQREPGMIAGLGVQQAPQMTAPAPPNVSGASQNSSGGAMPTPPIPPTGIPPSAPIPPQSLPHAPFPAPSMAPQGAQPDPASAPLTLSSLISGAQAASSNALPSATPPPGQPPAPEQVGPPNPNSQFGGPANSAMDTTLAGLGVTGAAAYLLKRFLGGGDYGRPGSTPQAMVDKGVPGAVAPANAPTTPGSVASAVNKGTPIDAGNIAPEVKPPAAPMHEPLVGESAPPSSPVAAAIEKSVPSEPTAKPGATMEAPYEPAYVRRGLAGPQQGPTTAPRPNQDPRAPVNDIAIPPREAPVPAFLKGQTSEQQFAKGVKPIGPPQSPVAAAMEKAVPTEAPNIGIVGRGAPPPAYLQKQRNSAEEIRGVKPIGPQVQGPPMGPGASQGPPELTTVKEAPRQIVPELPGMNEPMTATSPIGNILHPEPSPIEMMHGIPQGMAIKPRVRVKGMRLP